MTMQTRIIHLGVWMLLGCMHTMQGEIEGLLINFDNNMRELHKKVVAGAEQEQADKLLQDAEKSSEWINEFETIISKVDFKLWIRFLTAVSKKDDYDYRFNSSTRLDIYNDISKALKEEPDRLETLKSLMTNYYSLQSLQLFYFKKICHFPDTGWSEDQKMILEQARDVGYKDATGNYVFISPPALELLGSMEKSSNWKDCARKLKVFFTKT